MKNESFKCSGWLKDMKCKDISMVLQSSCGLEANSSPRSLSNVNGRESNWRRLEKSGRMWFSILWGKGGWGRKSSHGNHSNAPGTQTRMQTESPGESQIYNLRSLANPSQRTYSHRSPLTYWAPCLVYQTFQLPKYSSQFIQCTEATYRHFNSHISTPVHVLVKWCQSNV